MSKIKLTQIEPAFASPMMLFQVLDCEVLNRQLVEEAQAMRARSPGVTRSNREGWHSEDDFFGRTEPGCTALRTHILEAVQETTRLLSPHFDFAANRALCQGWINVNPPGAFNAPHDHSGFALSGVYYASVPPEGRSGAIEFLDPRVNANAYTIEGAACFNRKFIINPKPGNLLVFPSYLTHWVQPNGESTDRITVAFNIRYLKQQSDPDCAGHKARRCPPLRMLFARCPSCRSASSRSRSAPARGQSTGGDADIRCASESRSLIVRGVPRTRFSATVGVGRSKRFDANSNLEVPGGEQRRHQHRHGSDHEGLFVCLEPGHHLGGRDKHRRWCWGPSGDLEREHQDRNFRGGQAGRHLQRGASPGARCSVFSGSEVCRRIFEPHL